MSIRTICFGGLLASLLLIPEAIADMGRVYVSTAGVNVSEDAQKAIILHNGREEVLILGTELRADRPTPLIRFIPFPSEPQVSLAPSGVFERLAAIVAKYKLQYVYAFHSKGGRETTGTTGVEVRLSTKLGAHDLTIIQVHDPAVFRFWVNDYFRHKHLPYSSSYPQEESVVADYVKRGIEFFVLDYVEVPQAKRFIDPVVYRFKTTSLYYPLKTSNTFGGKGQIELFVVSPTTLCIPGSAILMDQFDQAVNAQGHAAGNCLNLPVKASTSAMLVPEENDLQAIYPDADAFFGKRAVFIQSIRYIGDYAFKDDILVPMPQGVPRALGADQYEDADEDVFSHALGEPRAVCRKKPERGPCKGRFESYYFDRQSQSCKSFFWGGCQGVVPFQTLDECKKACVTPAFLRK